MVAVANIRRRVFVATRAVLSLFVVSSCSSTSTPTSPEAGPLDAGPAVSDVGDRDAQPDCHVPPNECPSECMRWMAAPLNEMNCATDNIDIMCDELIPTSKLVCCVVQISTGTLFQFGELPPAASPGWTDYRMCDDSETAAFHSCHADAGGESGSD